MQQITYKGFPVTFNAYYQPYEKQTLEHSGIEAHYIIEELAIFGIDPYELLGDRRYNLLIAEINDLLMKDNG